MRPTFNRILQLRNERRAQEPAQPAAPVDTSKLAPVIVCAVTTCQQTFRAIDDPKETRCPKCIFEGKA